MIVYLGVFAVLSALALSTGDRKAGAMFWPIGIFLVWFMGFRYWTGCDYGGYLHRFENLPHAFSLDRILENEEIGFNLLINLVKDAGLEYHWLNVFASIILVICYTFFARAHRNSLMILALLFPIIIVQLGMSGIRQAIAGAFLMMATIPFVRGHRLATAAWIVAAMQFHSSAIMFLPIAFVAGRTISTRKLLAAMATIGPVAAFLLADRFDTYSNRYIEQIYGEISSRGAIVRYFVVMIPVAMFFRYQKLLEMRFPDVFPLLRLFALACLALAPLVAVSSVALHRINYYVMPFSILIFAYIVEVIPTKSRQTLRLLPVGIYGGYSFFWFLTSFHADRCYTPYDNIWFY